MSRKQEIYVDMLRVSLPYLRNVQTHSWWRKAKDRSCYHEAELIHNLPVSLLEPDFVDHDLWFLNHQARRYIEYCDPKTLLLYESNKKKIAELFRLVPESMRPKLEWNGPDCS